MLWKKPNFLHNNNMVNRSIVHAIFFGHTAGLNAWSISDPKCFLKQLLNSFFFGKIEKKTVQIQYFQFFCCLCMLFIDLKQLKFVSVICKSVKNFNLIRADLTHQKLPSNKHTFNLTRFGDFYLTHKG